LTKNFPTDILYLMRNSLKRFSSILRTSFFLVETMHDDFPEILISILNKYEKDKFLVVGEFGLIQQFKEVSGSKRRHIFLNEEGNFSREIQKFRANFYIAAGTTTRIIDHLRRDGRCFSHLNGIIFVLPEKQKEIDSRLGDFSFILSRINTMEKVFILSSRPSIFREDYPFLKSAQEITIEDIKENNVAKIDEQIINAMDDLVTKTKTYNEPEKLTEYKKIFKKCVPFGFRGWITAYLLKEYLSNNKSIKMPILTNSTTLFVGIGKNRKVYPKDLIHLIINTGKVERNHIGEIRILDNYSFVSIEKESADQAIDNLNGINYRGRNLNVNFARQKESST
jgi:hypothetical protein